MTTTNEHADIPDWGFDLNPRQRSGAARERPPHPVDGAHWTTPSLQAAPAVTVLRRAGLTELTPVFSTAVPPRGLSGKIRRYAYTFPDQRVAKWELLLFADRVDMIESALRDLLLRVRR